MKRMQHATELRRHAAPGGRPQPLAFHEQTLWVGSLETAHLYAIEPKTWSIVDDVVAPGKPYGLAAIDGALQVVISLGDDDDRYLYRFVPGQGFDIASKTACPDFTGSHLASDGHALYLVQQSNRRILAFDSQGAVAREIALPSNCGGIGFGSGEFSIISADEEFDELHLATFDLHSDRPVPVPLAAVSPESRGLTFDGTAWWTCYRDVNEIVSISTAAI